MKSIQSALRALLVLTALPIVATASVAGYQLTQDKIELPENLAASEALTLVKKSSKLTGLRPHIVQTNDSGEIHGRIVGFSGENVAGIGALKFDVVQAGKVIVSGVTDADGAFVISGLIPGGYGLQAQSDFAVVAFGFTVAPKSEETNYEHSFEVAALTQKVENLISNLSRPAMTTPLVHDKSLGVISGNRVFIRNGVLNGVVHSLYSDLSVTQTKVELRRAGTSLGVTQVDEKGRFQFSGLTAGIYEFLATGPNGYAAVSFEAVEAKEGDADTSLTLNSLKTVQVSTAVAKTQESDVFEVFEVVLIPQAVQTTQITDESFDEVFYIDDTIAGAGPTGASGFFSPGGGGPVFNGGATVGRGRLLGLTGLTLGIIALANDNDNAGGSPPSSPFNP